jgi:hypothetical protein
VDRPLSAFGTLLTLLALSVFAVSSTSRSTTIQSPRPDNRKPTSRYARGGSNFVLILPADIPEGDDDKPADSDQFARGQGDLARPGSAKVGSQCRIAPTRVAVVERMPATERIPGPMDYRSHYDAVYDRAVYGPLAEVLTPATRVFNFDPAARDSEVGDFLTILRSLSSSDRKIPAWSTSLVRMKLGFYLAAAQTWIWHWIASIAIDLGLARDAKSQAPSERIGWNDYAELVDQATRDAATTSTLAGGSDAWRGVRSGNWLRHSAASSLYQLGLALQSAAVQIRGDGDSAIATRTESQAR